MPSLHLLTANPEVPKALDLILARLPQNPKRPLAHCDELASLFIRWRFASPIRSAQDREPFWLSQPVGQRDV